MMIYTFTNILFNIKPILQQIEKSHPELKTDSYKVKLFKQSSDFLTTIKSFFNSKNNLLLLQFTEADINKM